VVPLDDRGELAQPCAPPVETPPNGSGRAGAAPAISPIAPRDNGDFLDPQAVKTSAGEAEQTLPAPAGADPGELAGAPPARTDPGANAEVIPPPPTPTDEDLARRRERAEAFKSLGEKFFDFPVTGMLYTRYRMRSGDGQRDQDMYQFLSLDVGDKNRQAVTGHLDARCAEDLTGHHAIAKGDVFAGIVDTYSNQVDATLYSAYADFNRIPGLDFLRAGRQFNYETPEVVQFDGLRFDTKPYFDEHETVFSVYGGIPILQYAHSSAGDDLAGLAIEGHPWKSARLRLDYLHVDDNLKDVTANSALATYFGLNNTTGFQHNDLAAISMWQTFQHPDLRLNGHFSILDGEPREALARAAYDRPDDQFQVTATWRMWFKEQGRLATEFDTYFDTLEGQEPFAQADLAVTKGWTEHFFMEAGAWLRRLVAGAEVEAFNREFERYYTTFQIRGLPIQGLTSAVTGSWWEAHGQGMDTGQVGGDVSYKWKKQFQSSIGTDFALYKYDLFTNSEHDRVRTYYVRQRWRPNRWAMLEVSFEHENSLSENFNTLTVSFRLTF
jgi:hypothetical protein